jgi:hypothetical protein
MGFLVAYALVAVYFFLQAIESLRPRESHSQVTYPGEHGLLDYPQGLRFYEDILHRDVEAYRRAWREVRVGQLNAEMAVQPRLSINRAKYAALRRLYRGCNSRHPRGRGEPIGTAHPWAAADSAPPARRSRRRPCAGPGRSVRFTDIGAREPPGRVSPRLLPVLVGTKEPGGLDTNRQILERIREETPRTWRSIRPPATCCCLRGKVSSSVRPSGARGPPSG